MTRLIFDRIRLKLASATKPEESCETANEPRHEKTDTNQAVQLQKIARGLKFQI